MVDSTSDRLNSNIFKNIFPEIVINMDIINSLEKNVKTSLYDVTQENHGFSIGDVLYEKTKGVYDKALADNSEKSIIAGVVTKVPSVNVFTLLTSGIIEYTKADFTDSSTLYLSNTTPGLMTHYLNISNTMYIPVGIYAGEKVIISIQQGSIGAELAPYDSYVDVFESYTQAELDDVINQWIGKVKT